MPELSQQHVCWSCCYRETCCKTKAIQHVLSSYQQLKFCPLCADSPTKHRNLVLSVSVVSTFESQSYLLQKKWMLIAWYAHHLFFKNSALWVLMCLKTCCPSFHVLLGFSWEPSCGGGVVSDACPVRELCLCGRGTRAHLSLCSCRRSSLIFVCFCQSHVSFFKLCCESHRHHINALHRDTLVLLSNKSSVICGKCVRPEVRAALCSQPGHLSSFVPVTS